MARLLNITPFMFMLMSVMSTVSGQELVSTTNCYSDSGRATRCEPPRQSFSFNRQPQANSTCGSPPMGFCSRQISIISGRVSSDCSGICDANDPSNAHPPELMTDFLLNDESWWQSENSPDPTHLVVIDLDLETLVEVSVITFVFASLKPNCFYILKSDDFGDTYAPYHYFATSCSNTYGIEPDQTLDINNETTVSCQSIALPPNPGQISFFPLLGRPSTNDSVPGYSKDLYNFITATNLRVILAEHYPITDLPVDDFGYHYAINDLNVVGSCQCNGHASSCRINFQSEMYECSCQHNTTGRFCERCADFYQDTPWRRANGIGEFECRACNCNGHSAECIFDPNVYRESGETSGGVCLNCSHNTSGRQCESCMMFYYPLPGLPLSDPNICQACDCNLAGVTNNGECAQENGQSVQAGDCLCKTHAVGRTCDQCIQGFFNLSADNSVGCQECGCNTTGAVSSDCDPVSGACQCKPNIIGDKCDMCLSGYYLPDPNGLNGCQPCNCNPGGSLSSQCDLITGQCVCRNGIQGPTCSETVEGFFFPSIDFLRLEAENAVGETDPIIETSGENVRFTGTGYARITANGTILLDLGSLTVLASGLYEAVVRYNLMGATTWESVTLTIVPGSELDTNPVSCGETPEITDRTSFTYISWMMGIGVTNTQTVCLRAGRSYTFLLHDFESGFAGDVAILDVDSLVLVPVNVQEENIFSDPQLTAEYLNCVNQYRSLSVQSSASPSCINTIFTFSAATYNGTLECGCDETGTVNGTNCSEFGGACFCSPGVRGRQCDQCSPRYFNLTSTGCTRCKCNLNGSRSDLCDLNSGACECFDNIVGRDCSSCDQNFQGFNEFGCIPCICDSIGSVTTQCNEVSGVCECKAGVVGESCDQCADLHYGFQESGCSSCDCDLTGSLDAECDLLSGQCSCLQNTVSRNCSQCRTGTFNLQDKNPYGCQNCFCSGQSMTCTSAEGFVRTMISTVFNSSDEDTQNGWGLVLNDLDVRLDADSILLPTTGAEDGIVLGRNSSLYLIAPLEYRGEKLSSYGQFLFVSIISLDGGVPESLLPYSVVLLSDEIRLGANLTEFDTGLFAVQLHETAGWINTNSLSPATAYELQQTLASLNHLLISASFDQDVILSEISLDTAVASSLSPRGEAVTWVEQCVCPAGYAGLSCEQCAFGYTRTLSNTCDLCECNGFSNTCDPETGECSNCSQFTTGTSCGQCVRGTYGDPTQGIICQTCPCPLTESVGQFSEDCVLLPDGNALCTNCPSGHSGSNCESCQNGFFGDPTGNITGQPSMCSDCQCSGNIDPNDPLSCDALTGMCLRCLGNTNGNSCERCADGFYGDALTAKNCTACECNSYGSNSTICNYVSGQCSCLPNVVGTRCDQCAAGYFGFGESSGCLPCNCDPNGALSSQCGVDGQCLCQPGVTGSDCDQCLLGYFNFTANGCQECSCSPINSGSTLCQSNGICDCRPGSTGSDCRQCITNYFQTDQGCTECPNCYQELQDEARLIEVRFLQSQTRSEFLTQVLDNSELTPYDPRFMNKQNIVEEIVDQVDDLSFSEGTLNSQYNELLLFITETLALRSRQIQFTLDELKSRSTPILVLASTSEELVIRIVNEFSEANMLLDIIRYQLLPAIETSANSVNDSFQMSVSAYQHLNVLLSQVSNQAEELTDVILELQAAAESALSDRDLLSDFISNTTMIVSNLQQNQTAIERRIDRASRSFASLVQSIRVLASRIESLSSLPPISSTSALRQLISNSNMTEHYISTDILSEVSSRYRQLAVLNETLNIERDSARQLQQQLENSESHANSQAGRGLSGRVDAEQAVQSGNQNVEFAEIILNSLREFSNQSSNIASDANEALEQVTRINSSVLLANEEAQMVRRVVGQSVNQINMAKDIASDVEQEVTQTQQMLSSFNSSNIVSSAISNTERSTSAQNNLEILSNETQIIEATLNDQNENIESTVARVHLGREQTNISKMFSEDAQNAISQLMNALDNLETIDTDKVSDIEMLLLSVFSQASPAAMNGFYADLSRQVTIQWQRRQELEATVEWLQEETNYLRQTLADVPAGCPTL